MGDPIRILQVVVNMNRGGAETLLMNLYRNMDRSKVQFDFLTSKPGVFDAEIEEMGGRIHRIPYVSEIGHTKYMQALEHFFETHPQYQIVHAHMDKMSGFVLRAAKKAGAPVRIAHSHNTSSEGGVAARAYKWVAGTFISSCATHFVACSNKAAKWLFANKVNKAMILKNGIESEKFAFSPEVREQVRQELGLSSESYVLGHVGRFAHQKNHSFLIDIFAQLHQEKPNAVLILAGDGPLRAEIEKKVEALHLQDKVKFLGVRSDITRLLQAFDMFVFPSLHEGLPVTLIEAQGAGLPCLISDKITQEVDMGIQLVERISLENKSVWIERINSVIARNLPRHIPSFSLSNNGYDIKNSASWTEGFYLGVLR
ncbi:glycosyltransferase family 1 protein [Paenibacillus chondroitinus]|uniref:Glycosyltransferase family 1 protein n=1 Tax=Paenibacillus chondroitinus TaxID=59842 RepID=A0ABU6DLL6_9BACL|nr:glycosyltransferase family 1 protein [Paenibacillus chondroitinus]MCY9660261.1 glycosyltransferase family 1 protein [Paenibacillus anseongense]MEB4797687.1 glycosyltransferase family 1 protein [Paenibacillus chondroitinus]